MNALLRLKSAVRPPLALVVASGRAASTSARAQADENSNRPPRTADDSTSALAYKEQQRSRPPPLPSTDLPRARSAEEAVTNILYNTPPPSSQPYKK
jgi:acetolactate synthase I/III small subunit